MPGPINCSPDATRVVGSLAGEAIDEALTFWGAEVASLGPRLRFGDDGFVALRAAGLLGLATDEPVFGVAVGRMPTGGPASGEFFCAGVSSSYEASDERYQMRLKEVAVIGTCDGDPVDGEVAVCFGHASCGSPAFVASLEGNAFASTIATRLEGFGLGDGSLVAEFDVADALSMSSTADAGFVWVDAAGGSPEPAGIQPATVTHARLVMPLGAPDPGAIYCASAGTLLYEFIDEFEFQVVSATLSQVRRVGSCDVVGDGILDVCAPG